MDVYEEAREAAASLSDEELMAAFDRACERFGESIVELDMEIAHFSLHFIDVALDEWLSRN